MERQGNQWRVLELRDAFVSEVDFSLKGNSKRGVFRTLAFNLFSFVNPEKVLNGIAAPFEL